MKQAEYSKTVLASGIRVVTEKIPYVRSISIGVWLTVGSRDEAVDNNGVSHFIEHLMFKGTNSRTASDIAQSLESVGGHLNAFTSKELTCYYAHVLDEHLPIATDVIADILTDSLFEETEMEKEKKVILDELSNIEETPEELIHELFLGDLFPAHSLGYSIIGKRQNILNFTRDDVVHYVNDNYTTNRVVIAAAGNVNHDELVQLIDKKFEKLPKKSQRNFVTPQLPTAETNEIENGAIQAHVCLGTHAYSYKNPKKFGLLALNTLLGSGMSSRLFQNIREKHGIAYSIYSFIDFLSDTGLLGIYVGTDRENIATSVELIRKELETLKREIVVEEELERTKSQLKGNLMLSLESTASRMNRLAKMEIYLQSHFSLDDTISEIEKVSQNDLLEIATELLDEKRISTTILKPKNSLSEGESKK